MQVYLTIFDASLSRTIWVQCPPPIDCSSNSSASSGSMSVCNIPVGLQLWLCLFLIAIDCLVVLCLSSLSLRPQAHTPAIQVYALVHPSSPNDIAFSNCPLATTTITITFYSDISLFILSAQMPLIDFCTFSAVQQKKKSGLDESFCERSSFHICFWLSICLKM